MLQNSSTLAIPIYMNFVSTFGFDGKVGNHQKIIVARKFSSEFSDANEIIISFVVEHCWKLKIRIS